MTRLRPVVSILLALALASCGDLLGPDTGRVRFVLSSGDAAPAPPPTVALSDDHDDDYEHHPYFVSANVTFSSILARNLDGVLQNISMDLPVTIDVVGMEERRRAVTLPDGELPPGTYDQVVVVMTAVQAVTHDGTTITIEPPGGGWTAIVPICPFDVEEGATAVVGLQLSVRRAFSWGDGRFRFRPAFECDAEPDGEPAG